MFRGREKTLLSATFRSVVGRRHFDLEKRFYIQRRGGLSSSDSMAAPRDTLAFDSRIGPSAATSLIDPRTTTQLVIFDKDGTLTECDKMFGDYIVEVVDRLRVAGFYQTGKGSDISRPLNVLFGPDWIGYDRAARKFDRMSPIIRNTAAENYQRLVGFQSFGESQFGFEKVADSPSDLLPKLKKALEGCEPKLIAENVVGCGDVEAVLERICSVREGCARIRCAVCTLDDRATTKWMLETLLGKSSGKGIAKFVDVMNCIDDVAEKCKPNPYGIWKICEELQIPVEETIMVGDSISDMQAGIRAGCKSVIFVESGGLDGNETKDRLQSNGDMNPRTALHVRKNVNEILDLI